MMKIQIPTDGLIEKYSDEKIREWLECDKLDAKTIKRLNVILKKNEKKS